MPIAFGVGIGDFLAVGKLIGQIVVELRENGEAAPEYQSLLLELEALSRALHQLETLQPTNHELLQLNAIRATALLCQRPLEEFLAKISKFDSRLGMLNVRDNRYKGFPRRMQWRVMYKEDVKQLRSILGSHVATINLLLMTQTIGSISAAEKDRETLACELRTEILTHRRLLEDVKARAELSKKQQLETKLQMEEHSVSLDNLENKVDQTHKQLQDLQSIVSNTRAQTASILTAATDIMVLATSGATKLRLIAQMLSKMFELCARFTTEMRSAMAELLQLFSRIEKTLHRIENGLPRRVDLPVVQFTDALGDTMALPYQLCQQWASFKELLDVIFINKPGKNRVERGQYLIMNENGGRILKEASWDYAIKQDDHLSMSMVLYDLEMCNFRCPFPSCRASTEGVKAKNRGRKCPECHRWATSGLLASLNNHPNSTLEEGECDKMPSYGSSEGVGEIIMEVVEETVKESMKEIVELIVEETEVYRQVEEIVKEMVTEAMKEIIKEIVEVIADEIEVYRQIHVAHKPSFFFSFSSKITRSLEITLEAQLRRKFRNVLNLVSSLALSK